MQSAHMIILLQFTTFPSVPSEQTWCQPIHLINWNTHPWNLRAVPDVTKDCRIGAERECIASGASDKVQAINSYPKMLQDVQGGAWNKKCTQHRCLLRRHLELSVSEDWTFLSRWQSSRNLCNETTRHYTSSACWSLESFLAIFPLRGIVITDSCLGVREFCVRGCVRVSAPGVRQPNLSIPATSSRAGASCRMVTCESVKIQCCTDPLSSSENEKMKGYAWSTLVKGTKPLLSNLEAIIILTYLK